MTVLTNYYNPYGLSYAAVQTIPEEPAAVELTGQNDEAPPIMRFTERLLTGIFWSFGMLAAGFVLALATGGAI